MRLGLFGAMLVLRNVMLHQSRHADCFNLKLLRAQRAQIPFSEGAVAPFLSAY
jgi:hypothetical protein